ncbi:MAG TPA: CHAT domain-containing protein, partial [Blastocatellia bacterium]|nr:CHAT domain-containing protein [Blastocatellia bacterium]
YNLGDAHRDLGERDKALAYYERALAHRMAARENLQEQAIAGLQTKQEIIRPVIDEELDVLNSIGQLYTAMANEQKAAEYFQHALSLGKTAANPGRQAQALYNLAQIARKRGDLQHARAQIEEALQLVESMRAKMSDEGLRSAYFATVQDYYEFYVSLLMQLHKQNGAAGLDRLALEAAERGRARTLLDLLREAGTDIRQGIGPELLKREFQVRQQLRAKAEAQVRLLANRRAPQQEEQIRKEIAALETEYQQVRAAIRSKRPQYAALTQPQLLSAREIQEKLLDADTLLLEYALGKERSYLWAVTPEAIASYELPGRAEIEEAARRVYRLLTARQPVHGEREAQYRARAAQADAQYWPEAARLSRMLLGPVASQLGAKRLLVVADGALHYIPFAALPSPVQAAANQGDAPPLIVHHEILNLPSASALGVLREETAARKPAPKTVAVLADPVFDKDDDRVRKQPGAKRSEQKPQEDAPVSRSERALREFDISAPGMGIPRLPFSREEAEAITALSPADALKALGFAANRATVVSPEMGRYRVVHFATHGLLNSHHPDLSGLLLSLVDEQGNPQDGFLQLHEVYNLNLPADLVVLSACQTALGKEVKGEGLVGLTRGFMYAGAQRVMASLWKVNDASTAVFMKRFYGGMLKEGLRPAAALRAAQIEMAKQKLWQSPYYWAAFVIQGEWR